MYNTQNTILNYYQKHLSLNKSLRIPKKYIPAYYKKFGCRKTFIYLTTNKASSLKKNNYDPENAHEYFNLATFSKLPCRILSRRIFPKPLCGICWYLRRRVVSKVFFVQNTRQLYFNAQWGNEGPKGAVILDINSFKYTIQIYRHSCWNTSLRIQKSIFNECCAFFDKQIKVCVYCCES